MNILWLILKIIGLYLLLRGLIFLTYKNVLLNQRRRALWLIIMAAIGLLLVWGLSGFKDAQTLIGWSAVLAIISITPNDHRNKEEKQLMNKLRDARFELIGLKSGRQYFNWGLALFMAGVVIGWILFFTVKPN
jgi:hypothetical protein